MWRTKNPAVIITQKATFEKSEKSTNEKKYKRPKIGSFY